MIRQWELVERVKAYDPTVNEDLLNRAYVFAMKAHGTQMRASGDPYFSHPLEVASILTEMKMDSASIACALLHDTIEDTGATEEDLKKMFGDEVARLVVGVTKLGRLEFQSDKAHQAENFRKLIVAMAEDIRVLLVKLADRLHNMRTLHFLKKEEKRRQKAAETLEIYAPLSERMGIKQMQEELEDLAFAELHKDARESILARLKFLRQEGSGLAASIITELQQLMDKSGLKAKVMGREKTPYSIWRKMKRKNIAFEQLSDIIAFRIIVENVEQCYQALGIIHSHYSVVPGRFKDYISTTKPNGYQSLHTGVIGPLKHRIEVQIRSERMEEIAELGVAAHWAYKHEDDKVDGKQYRWLRELLDIVESAQRPEEFLDYTRLELFHDQVFCFTPKGDLIALPRSSTPVDFAYAVHSKVGDHCVGAKVNGRMVPLRTQLRNGDQVEVVTSKTGSPSPAWERFVVSAKARSQIRRFVRNQQRSEYMALGKPMLQKLFSEEGVAFNEKDVEAVVKQFQAENLEDLYANIGSSLQSARDVLKAVYPGHLWRVETSKTGKKSAAAVAAAAKTGKPLTLRGLIPGMAVHYARCCHPLPGDRIVGIVTTGKGVTIHTSDCDTLESFSGQPERWIDVAWEDAGHGSEKVVGRLNVVIANLQGALANLTGSISRSGGNIINLKITNRTVDFFDVLVDVEVSNVDQLNTIIAGLRATPLMISVERAKNR
ncbi:MAG: bifunctional (p)ppGpp synthetase/guanosine-3',5'-bis(diphosphate) 3'-pyrophosphohydrolase [Proteobacteria bacterium]|nr:bifunctional (p)ppGpp synthetase/guanosine-3',5'-bis(diphosphate) 3'-pyrophosphohydrolase [Pseudomonadota bacterium]